MLISNHKSRYIALIGKYSKYTYISFPTYLTSAFICWFFCLFHFFSLLQCPLKHCPLLLLWSNKIFFGSIFSRFHKLVLQHILHHSSFLLFLLRFHSSKWLCSRKLAKPLFKLLWNTSFNLLIFHNILINSRTKFSKLCHRWRIWRKPLYPTFPFALRTTTTTTLWALFWCLKLLNCFIAAPNLARISIIIIIAIARIFAFNALITF